MRIATLFGMLFFLAAVPLHAAQVELQLVVHDQPGTTVDKLERSQVITRPVATAKGVEMKVLGVDVVCWASGRPVAIASKPAASARPIPRIPIRRRLFDVMAPPPSRHACPPDGTLR